MSISTRQQLLDAALRLFARRGFYGASLSGIADELGLTKQALLHHFGTKEKLYGEILVQISEAMLGRLRHAKRAHASPREQLDAFFGDFLESQLADVDRAQILMRELLDNRARAAKARSWYLRPFLEDLVEITRALPSREPIDEPEALAFVYSMLGAVHYFAVSEPTLAQMFGRQRYVALSRSMKAEIRSLARVRIESLVAGDLDA